MRHKRDFVTHFDSLSLSRYTVRSRRSEEHTSELQSQSNLVCRLLLEKKKNNNIGILPGYRSNRSRRELWFTLASLTPARLLPSPPTTCSISRPLPISITLVALGRANS